MIQPQKTTGQKISTIGGTVGTVLGGINAIRGLFTSRKKEDARQLEQQRKLQELQIGGSKELADYEQALKMKMWQDTNYGAQMKEAAKAGISKAAAIGGSGTGTQGASVGGTTGGVAANAAATQGAGIEQQMAMAQIANMMANTNKTIEETKDIAGVNRGQKQTELEGKQYDTEIKGATVNAEILRIQRQSEIELENLAQERNETYISNETYREEVKQVKIDTAIKELEVTAKEAGIALTREQTRQIGQVIKQNWKTLEQGDEKIKVEKFKAAVQANYPNIMSVIGRMGDDAIGNILKGLGKGRPTQKNID